MAAHNIRLEHERTADPATQQKAEVTNGESPDVWEAVRRYVTDDSVTVLHAEKVKPDPPLAA